MGRLVDADFAQMIANTEMSDDDAGKVQWVLSHTPTVDAEPVKHGKWIPCENGGYYCSNCDSRVAFLVHNRYCSNCGSMNGGGSDGKIS